MCIYIPRRITFDTHARTPARPVYIYVYMCFVSNVYDVFAGSLRRLPFNLLVPNLHVASLQMHTLSSVRTYVYDAHVRKIRLRGNYLVT